MGPGMASTLQASGEHSLTPSAEPIPPQQAMRALKDHNSEELSEPGYSSSKSPNAPAEQPRMLPDADAIIRQTRAEMEQARLKADELIGQFAKKYVEAAGKLREEAIQRYRRRLEGLPADVCATVCETLATNDDFCGTIEFGKGHLTHGGMRFTYRAESDTAFNALSHHVWKDFHHSFLRNDCPPPSGNVLEHGLPSVGHLTHYDEEQTRLVLEQSRPSGSSEDIDLSSGEDDSMLSGDSTGGFLIAKSKRSQSSFSPSPGWDTENQIGSLNAARRHGTGRSSKHQNVSDAPEKQGRSRPSNEPWSADEEALIQEIMAAHSKKHGNLEIGENAMKLLELLPRRSVSGIRNKWRALKMKHTQPSWAGTEGNERTYNDKHKAQAHDTDRQKRGEAEMGPTTEDEEGDGDDPIDHAVKRVSRVSTTHAKNKWTPEQDQLLTHMMKSEMQPSVASKIPIPPLVKKELARSLGRSEKAISRRWVLLSGHGTQNVTQESKKSRKQVLSTPAKNQTRGESQSAASSSTPQMCDTAQQSEAVRGAGPRCPGQPPSSIWSTEEKRSIIKSTEGLIRSQIDFKEVAAALPDPSKRTADACRAYWRRYIQPILIDQGLNPFQVGEAPQKKAGSGSKIARQPIPRHSETRRASESVREAPGGTAVSTTQGSKHARESDDQSEKQSSTSRRKHNRLPDQSSFRGRADDGGSEAEGFGVYRYDSE